MDLLSASTGNLHCNLIYTPPLPSVSLAPGEGRGRGGRGGGEEGERGQTYMFIDKTEGKSNFDKHFSRLH